MHWHFSCILALRALPAQNAGAVPSHLHTALCLSRSSRICFYFTTHLLLLCRPSAKCNWCDAYYCFCTVLTIHLCTRHLLSFVLKQPSLFGCVITGTANKASLMRLLNSGVHVTSVSSSTTIQFCSMLLQCTCCSQLYVYLSKYES